MNGLRHETILQIKDVSLTFDRKPILNHLNAEIHNIEDHGQVVALLGPSGCGKTTAFSICAGLIQPTSGQVLLGEKGIPVRPGMVGVVFQNYPLFEHRTILGNLTVAARQKNGQKEHIKERVFAMLERFQLTDKKNAYPTQLSGGQRQRVAIARQLLSSEHYLLMDEPFSGLDPLMKNNVCQLIGEISAADDLNTIIITTHDIESATMVADEIWLMGRQKDTNGNFIGAHIVERFDLIDQGLAWHPELAFTPDFSRFVQDIRAKFREL